MSFLFSQGRCFCQAIIMPFGKIHYRKDFFIMEKELVWKMVQGQIGYDFKNLDLLQQAFTRRSYTAENGGESNEVLEMCIRDRYSSTPTVREIAGAMRIAVSSAHRYLVAMAEKDMVFYENGALSTPVSYTHLLLLNRSSTQCCSRQIPGFRSCQ